MAHLVNVVKLNEQGEQLCVKYTHKFVFEATARKWADGFNQVYVNDDGDDDHWVAVYAGEKDD